MRSPATALLAAALASGCSLDVAQPAVLLLEAEVSGTPAHPDLHGSAAAVSQAGHTEAVLHLDGELEGMALGWGIHRGGCADPAERIGPAEAYGPLHPHEDGGLVAGTTLPVALVEDERYAVVVHPADDPDGMAACGEFEPIDP